MSRVVTLTGLGMQDPERLHTLFNTQTVDGCLHKAGFDLCIRTLVPGNTLTYIDKQYVGVYGSLKPARSWFSSAVRFC